MDTSQQKNPRYIFWLDNFKVLYQNGNFYRFVPTYDMTRVEQLNAITRFCIYFIILIILFSGNEKWLFLPIFVIAMIILIYNVYDSDLNGKSKEFQKRLNYRKIDRLKKLNVENNVSTEKDFDCTTCNLDLFEEDDKPKNPNDVLETGYYDSGNNLIIGSEYDPPNYVRYKDPSLYTYDELMEYKNASCRKPTADNPFMNPFTTDYGTEYVPVACNANDDEIKQLVGDAFDKNLYRNVDDVFERENSKRQFYTIPATSVPNQQKEFAEWLFKSPVTCKEDQENCLRYEDLRFKRQLFQA